MKLQELLTFSILLLLFIAVLLLYDDKMNKIENGEITQVSESYRDR